MRLWISSRACRCLHMENVMVWLACPISYYLLLLEFLCSLYGESSAHCWWRCESMEEINNVWLLLLPAWKYKSWFSMLCQYKSWISLRTPLGVDKLGQFTSHLGLTTSTLSSFSCKLGIYTQNIPLFQSFLHKISKYSRSRHVKCPSSCNLWLKGGKSELTYWFASTVGMYASMYLGLYIFWEVQECSL